MLRWQDAQEVSEIGARTAMSHVDVRMRDLYAVGVLHESYVHLRYKWLNYYVRMSKTSPCTPIAHERF